MGALGTSPVPDPPPRSSPRQGCNKSKSLKKKKCTERKTENTDQSRVNGRNSTFYLRFTEKVTTFPLGDIPKVTNWFEEINTEYIFLNGNINVQDT